MNPIAPARETLVPSFASLAKVEPRLWGLLAEALGYRMADTPEFCQMGTFCGYPGFRPGLKPRLTQLVGWNRDHPILGTTQAYDVVYQTILEALPDCRRCPCTSPEGETRE